MTEAPPRRLWPVSIAAVLVALAFVQQPGRLVADTKLDLLVNPGDLMQRAMHAWTPDIAFGQLTNQGYGYLFPMGPAFLLGDLAAVPSWIQQRLWWSALLVGAFTGMYLLTGRLGVTSMWARIGGALAYALTPRLLTTLGPISAETVPLVVLPWMMLPLLRLRDGGSVRSAASRSALAWALTGGVNAAASLAVLPAPALFLATRRAGVVRRRLVAWWIACTVLAATWWLVPLVVLGRYSPPFLDWIESATTTTATTGVVEAVRGTTHWIAWFSDGVPAWPGGYLLATEPAFVLQTLAISAIGLVGLALRDVRERPWLLSTLFAGLLLLTLGHVGSLSPAWAETVRGWLDGPLSPFRNIHKFQPLVSLPICVGVAYSLDRLAVVRPWRDVALRPIAAVTVGFALVGCAAPLLADRLGPEPSYDAVPAYWEETADFLREQADEGTALVVPGNPFGSYLWGFTRDEPLQPLEPGAWAVRDAVPLTPAGTIRLLDVIENRFTTGAASPALAAALQRLGVRWLVVRNDLDRTRSDAPRPVLVHQVLASAGGIRRVAGIGPAVGAPDFPGLVADQFLERPYPAVEVYEVPPAPLADLTPLEDVVQVRGGPDSLPRLLDAGLLPDVPVVLSDDGAADAFDGLAGDQVLGPVVVTDDVTERERDFGRVHDAESAVRSRGEPVRLERPSADYEVAGAASVPGAWSRDATVAASSSDSDVGRLASPRTDRGTAAAFDGAPDTAWWSAVGTPAVGQWLEVRLPEAADLRGATIELGTDGFGVSAREVAVLTDDGERLVEVTPDVPVDLGAGTTARLRVRATRMSDGSSGQAFVVRELDLAERRLSRPLQVDAASDRPAVIHLSAQGRARAGCVDVGGRPLCATGLARPAEESVVIERDLVGAPRGPYAVQAEAWPRPGPELTSLVDDALGGARVTASSSAVEDLRGRPSTVVDGRQDTGWVAAPGDPTPTLRVDLGSERTVTGLRVVIDPALAASRPDRVEIEGSGQLREVQVVDGRASFEPIVTDALSIRFLDVVPVRSYDPVAGSTDLLPVGLSELRLSGVETALLRPALDADVSIPCGQGPTITVDGAALDTSLATTAQSLVSGDQQALTTCEGQAVSVRQDTTSVRMERSGLLVPATMTLSPPDVPESAGSSAGLAPRIGSATTSSVELPAREAAALLRLRGNANAGWQATLGGESLTQVEVDGGRLAFVVPAGDAGVVRISFAPDGVYRAGLVAGAILLALLAVLALRREHGAVAHVDQAGRRGRTVLVLVLGAAALVNVGGVVAVVCMIALTSAVVVARRVRDGTVARALPWLVAAATLPVMIALQLRPWGDPDGYAGRSGVVESLVVVALTAVLVSVLPGPRSRSARIEGRSTAT